MTDTFSLKPYIALTALLASASSLPVAAAEYGEFFGNLRAGVITAEDSAGVDTDGSAIGGKFGYLSPNWNGLSGGATVYATQELFDDEEGSFFGANRSSYALLGEAFLQAKLGNTTIKGGRFEFDSPHADTDDIRMVPNTFQGAFLSNTDLADTTLYAGYLSKWAGVDTDTPEEFQNINGDKGLSLIGASYDGIDHVNLQAWFYQAKDFVEMTYLEATYGNELFEMGAQFGSQNDDTPGGGAIDGDVYGVFGSVNISDFTLMLAYNDVSGTVTNGFGGGPFFTSSDDHTVAEVEDQEAVAINIEYGGIENFTFGIFDADFRKGEDETHYYSTFQATESLSFELIHVDMRQDGNNTRLMANLSF